MENMINNVSENLYKRIKKVIKFDGVIYVDYKVESSSDILREVMEFAVEKALDKKLSYDEIKNLSDTILKPALDKVIKTLKEDGYNQVDDYEKDGTFISYFTNEKFNSVKELKKYFGFDN